MNSGQLKQVLRNYCQETIKSGEIENTSPEHIFSKSFENKMNKLIKKEKYYAKYLKTVPVIKATAIIILIAAFLITAIYAIISFNLLNSIINTNKKRI